MEELAKLQAELEELQGVLNRAEADRRVREQAERAAEEEAEAYRLDTLVGHDPRMIEVYKLVGQLAASRVTVLIRGETGTGKEIFAHGILRFHIRHVFVLFFIVFCHNSENL